MKPYGYGTWKDTLLADSVATMAKHYEDGSVSAKTFRDSAERHVLDFIGGSGAYSIEEYERAAPESVLRRV
jgi:hypothetical protein